MDANEDMHSQPGTLQTFLQDTELADIIYGCFATAEHQPPPTYKRGRSCIDYAFATSDILPYVRHCGYTRYDEVTSSDHRGLFIDLSMNEFLQCQPPAMATPDNRILATSNPRNVRCYKAALYKYLHDHQWFQRMQDLRQELSSPIDSTQLQRLREQAQAGLNDLIRGMQLGESKLKQRPRNPFFRKALSSTKTNGVLETLAE